MKKIIIVDDEKEITDLIAVYLENEGYGVVKFYEPTRLLDELDKIDISLAILDIMMPEINGFDLCQILREKYTFPIIMLTAKDEQIDKITGLMLGADDYMTKPFQPLELVARVKAQLRRSEQYQSLTKNSEAKDTISYEKLKIDLKGHLCTLDDQVVQLTSTEFLIVKELVEKQQEVVSGESLFHAVWKEEYFHKSNNTITVHIRHIREKMRKIDPTFDYIKTVWGVGYKIG